MERTEEALRKRVRETPLSERLTTCEKYIASMCAERRPPKMTIPLQHYDEDFYIYTTLADAQATIAALQARVQELEARQHFGACAKCLTNAWRICKEGTPDAVEMKCSNGSTWWLCDYCLSKKQLTQRTAELEAANKLLYKKNCELGRFETMISDLQAELERVRGERDEDNKIGLPVIVELLRQADKGQDGPLSVLKGIIAERDTLRADHARVLGLVQAAVVRIEQVEGDLHAALNGTRHDPSWIRPIQLSRNERQELYLGCESQLKAIRQSLPAQPAQGGA